MALVAAIWFFFLVVDIWGVISNALFPHETLKEWHEEQIRAAVEANANARLKRKATKGKDKAVKGKDKASVKDKGKVKARPPPQALTIAARDPVIWMLTYTFVHDHRRDRCFPQILHLKR